MLPKKIPKCIIKQTFLLWFKEIYIQGGGGYTLCALNYSSLRESCKNIGLYLFHFILQFESPIFWVVSIRFKEQNSKMRFGPKQILKRLVPLKVSVRLATKCRIDSFWSENYFFCEQQTIKANFVWQLHMLYHSILPVEISSWMIVVNLETLAQY